MTREIQLSQGMVSFVDDEDFEKVNSHKWFLCRSNQTYYAIRHARINGKVKTFSIHREVLKAPKGLQVDHINHNGLDNRKENLRLATNTENARNKKSTGHKGVCWNKSAKMYQAKITINYKSIHLGCFESVSDAAKAYDKAAKNYFGDFAQLNFPEKM